jgi:hypothetical protein
VITSFLAQVLCILALFHVAVVSADTPTTVGAAPIQESTPTPQESGVQVGTTPVAHAQDTATVQQATSTQTSVTPTQTSVTPTQTSVTPAQTSVTPTPIAPTQTPVTSTQTPISPTQTAPVPRTSHLAVQVSDAVVSVEGVASSEVFVSLMDIEPGVRAFHLSLRFDPQIVRLVDADENAANGIQVLLAPTFVASQVARIAENRVDNGTGQIALGVLLHQDNSVHETLSWQKVATLNWIGQKKGNSVISVNRSSHLVMSDGQQLEPDSTHDGTVFVRLPGQIQGIVRLQGREEYSSASVTSSLAAAYVDTVRVSPNGRFDVASSHGEGFYTLMALAPGYLSAESDRPVKLTVGSVIDLKEVTLYGGDANGDDRIDVRDLSYVAWHLNTDDAHADINGDGQVDILDLSLVAGNFGHVGPTVWHVAATDDVPAAH